jgi:antitoxin YefM
MPKIKRRPKPETSYVSYTEFRESLAALMDQVCDGRAPLHVTRQGGRAVVVISEEEFDGWVETAHLLQSPANVRRLLASIASANAGKFRERY